MSQALSPASGEGPIAVVQTTNAKARAGRVAGFNAGRYPVRLRGSRDGAAIDETIEVRSVSRGLAAATDWQEITRVFVDEARVVISNTGDRGFTLDASDRASGAVPASFPAKLTRLLHARHREGAAPLDIYPCELIGSNGDTLRRLVLGIASDWSLGGAFTDWLGEGCRWVNSLVDRIVSASIEPVGAVAEPYALWAIEARPGLEPPCRHPDIVLTDRLIEYERLKLFVLNLGHTVMAELWSARGAPAGMTVRDAMHDTPMRTTLDAVYEDEVMPVFAALGMGEAARDYRITTMARFLNPFLDHRLADILDNHEAKRERRFRPLIALASRHAPHLPQPWLRRALQAPAGRLAKARGFAP